MRGAEWAVPLGFLGLGLVFLAVWVAAVVFWILALVDVARTPEHQFRAAGEEKVVWVLVVALVSVIGALIWWFAARRRVRAFAGAMPPAPPGWYPDAAEGTLRWWDGRVWTEHRHRPPTV